MALPSVALHWYRSGSGRRALLALLLPLLALLTPAGAAAQESAPEALSRMKDLDRQALADYKAEDFESARIGLREAIAVGTRAGLSGDPQMAKLQLHLGAVLINGFQDKLRGARALAAAVKIDPNVPVPEAMATPDLKEALAAVKGTGTGTAPKPSPFDSKPAPAPAEPRPAPQPEAKPAPPAARPPAAVPAPPPAAAPPTGAVAAPAGAPPAAPPSPAAGPPAGAPAVASTTEAAPAQPPPRRRRKRSSEEPDLPANIPRPLFCPVPDEAPPEEDIVLYCVMQPEVKANKVVLRYRGPGEEKFSTASTSKTAGGWYRVVIPGRAVSGKSMQYYVEARDAAGEPVANAGRDDSPNLVMVRDGAEPLGKLYAGISGRRRASADDEPGEPAEEDDPLKAVAEQRERERAATGVHRRRVGALFLGLAAGAGYGWHPKEKLEFYDTSTIDAGWIPSGLFHLLPEIGYQLRESLALSLQLRLQVISQQGSGDAKPGAPASGAFALLGRLQYFIGGGNLQGSLSLYAGGGDGFRLTIGPQLPDNLRNDSVKGGPLVAGLGFGLIYHFTSNIAVVADAKLLGGFPTSAVVIDGGGGLQVGF
jgi:hypothetical protein